MTRVFVNSLFESQCVEPNFMLRLSTRLDRWVPDGLVPDVCGYQMFRSTGTSEDWNRQRGTLGASPDRKVERWTQGSDRYDIQDTFTKGNKRVEPLFSRPDPMVRTRGQKKNSQPLLKSPTFTHESKEP